MCVPAMTTPEAFAAIALAAVACDGKLGRDEAHALRCQLEYRSLYNDSSEAAMGELFDRLLQLLREQGCLLYTSPSPRDLSTSRMPSSA